MKKFLCSIGHPKILTRVSKCNIDNFENDNEEIRVFRCKYCGDFVYAYTRFVKLKFKKPHLDTTDLSN